MVNGRIKKALLVAAAGLLIAAFCAPTFAQDRASKGNQISKNDRGISEDMLTDIYHQVQENYYDPTFHGVDIKARYKDFQHKIKEAQTLGAAFADIAGYLEGLHDSHTYFLPPLINYRYDYGVRFQMVGDAAVITEVRPGSDAASHVQPGDQILTLDRYYVTRMDIADLDYYFYTLAPQPALNLVVRDPRGKVRSELIHTKYVKTQQVYDIGSVDMWRLKHEEDEGNYLRRQRWVDQGDVMIWKMPDFFVAGGDLKRIMTEALKHSALILDLRSNPGGSGEALTDLLGYFFDHDVTICTRQTRYEKKPLVARSHGHDLFTGKLVVLVDSESASSAELFARTIQLQHRGIVVGDRTAGQVMEAQIYPRATGAGLVTAFAVSITHASLTMPDGQSLEGVGVTPDVMVIPTTADMAVGQDPALSRAAELAGIKLDPTAAGKLFPFEWAPLQ